VVAVAGAVLVTLTVTDIVDTAVANETASASIITLQLWHQCRLESKLESSFFLKELTYPQPVEGLMLEISSTVDL
jgi:hypothetical protein